MIGGPQKAAIGDDLWVLSMLKKEPPSEYPAAQNAIPKPKSDHRSQL